MKDKLIQVWRRFIASYLRALGAVLVGVQAGSALNWLDVSFAKQLGMAAIGALFGPIAKALMETADAVDSPNTEEDAATSAESNDSTAAPSPDAGKSPGQL